MLVASVLVFASWPLASKAKEKRPSRILLVTSPRKEELVNIKFLVKRGLLKVKGLKVLGIYHADEYTDYGPAYKWLRDHGPKWMGIRRIKCHLDADRVFESNGCSDEFKKLFDESDGLIFTGGPDIPPSMYGEKTAMTTVILDPPRHRFEISFLHHLLIGDQKSHTKAFLDRRPDYLVLGLCLGLQSLNVAMGGTLIQDIPSEVYGVENLEQAKSLPAEKLHRSIWAQLDPAPEVGWGVMHPIKFLSHPLAKRMAPALKKVEVLSLHHQAIKRLGKGLLVWASSMDGKIVEAVAHQRFHSVLGVQFHPEKRVLYDPLRTYLPQPKAHGRNFVTDIMKHDSHATAFLKSFWVTVSDMLKKSSRLRHALAQPVR